jgi:hypothetical protein
MMKNNLLEQDNSGYQPEINDQLDIHGHDVIYALRTAHQHQSQLLVVADQKANILVGILAVILTIIFTKADVLTHLSGKFSISIACFIVLEVVALILALLVIMPKTIGRLNTTNIENIPNPFFFGFYTRFGEDEYLEYLSRRLNNDKSARYLLGKDLYQIGFVLKRKYVLLKYAYVLAVVGVILLTSSTVVLLLIQ